MHRPPRQWKRHAEVPEGPSQWELLLTSLGMDEDMAFEAAPRDARLLSFVRHNRQSRYVPERVLKALGMYGSGGW
jgi:hypothetical protein